jgi:glycosyltransferase involved in cell wall biosynthesis
MIRSNGLVVNTRSVNRRLTGVERYTAEVTACMGNILRSVRPRRDLPPVAGHFWEQVILPLNIKGGELLWSPANIGPVAVTDQVLTLHDCSIIEHPEWFQPLYALWYRAILPILVRRVKRVLTVSEHSKRHIQTLFKLPAKKVVSIQAGVNGKNFHPATKPEITRVRQHYGLPEKYLLFLGTLEPRKNLVRLYEVWKLAQPEQRGVELVIAGSPAPQFAPVHSQPSPHGMRYLGYIPESDLAALYSGASAYLLPSMSEGFGLTVLEAMACGTPVIAACAGALPETIGPAGLLLDPLDIAGWARAISNLLRDEDCWQDYRQRGLERARQFTWEGTARKVLQELEATL